MTAQYILIIKQLNNIFGELARDGKGRILFAVAAGWFLSIGIRFIYPSLLPFFRTEFDFTLTTGGMLLSTLWLAYAIGQFPGGVLGDQIGEGNILALSTAISAGAILLVTVSVNLSMLFFGTFVFGLATSLYGPTRFTIFTDIYDEEAGTAVGLSHASGSIGNTLLPIMATGIATYSTWRAGFGVLVPVLICITLGLWFWVPGRTSKVQKPANEGMYTLIRRIISVIPTSGIPIIVAIQILLAFLSQGVLGFYPTYLIEIKGFPPAIAATLFGLYFAIGIIVQVLGGLSNDWLGPRTTLVMLVGLFMIGLFGLYLADTILFIVLSTILLSHRNATGVVTNTFVANALSDEIKGSGLGFLRSGWIFIGATSPIFVGYVGDLGFLQEAFLLLAFIAVIATLLTFFVPKG